MIVLLWLKSSSQREVRQEIAHKILFSRHNAYGDSAETNILREETASFILQRDLERLKEETKKVFRCSDFFGLPRDSFLSFPVSAMPTGRGHGKKKILLKVSTTM